MKKLSQYLNENNSRIFEGETLQYFMLNYESDGKEEGVEEYFKRHNLLKNGRIDLRGGKYITLEEIKAVYEYAEEHDMPCPMVVDYKGNPGDFVFRRWVAQLSDIFEGIDIIQEKGKPFQGLHNTNMKEDGKWFPSAEDMESVISYAYNKVNNLFKTDPENILYVTGKELESNSKAEQLMQYYAGNQKALDNIVGSLPNNLGKMRKLPTSSKATNEWIELGKYKNFPTVLLCNKNDLQGDNKITDQELNSYCKSISLFNVTASNGDGIAKAFETVARMGMKKCSEDDFE